MGEKKKCIVARARRVMCHPGCGHGRMDVKCLVIIIPWSCVEMDCLPDGGKCGLDNMV